ncbi:hypothetical protein J2045_000584 [Peteryoungia aggregata LMG 23059]|uniref:Transposase IS4-like domain-containing protein n=1 Tax=Peteryoungia aggregata LMG 23059 TaxID=1368425 RepID=A0ABU0G3P0_9HYPH|nr:hypothetical protein [Peteryoungia aggregata LMG 23059]
MAPGQWLDEKHGAKSRHGWQKLRLAVDADSGEIIVDFPTDLETGDVSQQEPLLDQVDDEIDQLTADGAHGGYPSYDAARSHSEGSRVVIPPNSYAVERPSAQASFQRDDHIADSRSIAG